MFGRLVTAQDLLCPVERAKCTPREIALYKNLPHLCRHTEGLKAETMEDELDKSEWQISS